MQVSAQPQPQCSNLSFRKSALMKLRVAVLVESVGYDLLTATAGSRRMKSDTPPSPQPACALASGMGGMPMPLRPGTRPTRPKQRANFYHNQ